jgi:hypothetical protein
LTANEAPAHVIAAWIGHSVTVQNNAYAIVSDGHFEQFNGRHPVTQKKVAHQVAHSKPMKTLAFRNQTVIS